MRDDKSKKSEFFRDCIDFIFGFENKKGEVLDHWITFMDNFSFPPQEFYDAIEKELAARKIPSLEISREEFAQGGPLSGKRMYLRMFRERLALYTCASSFGDGYFFSCRTVYVPALVRLWHILALMFFFNVVFALLVKPLGVMFAVVAVVALMFAIAGVLRNTASMALSDLDSFLLKIPVISTVYEHWFREDTFYRVDTRLVYLQRVPALVRELAEEITAAKGVKLGPQYQRASIFGELYKPVPPSQPPK